MKDNPFDNGAKGNISEKDELIPIDYDGLMEKMKAADRIEPQVEEAVAIWKQIPPERMNGVPSIRDAGTG